MRKVLLFSLILGLFTIGFSQSKTEDSEVNIITYQVKLGETVRTISKKFLVAPSQIYNINKAAVDGVTEGMILYIPVPKKETVDVVTEETQEQNNVSKKTTVKESVVAPEVLKEEVVTNKQESKTIKHKVEAHQTLYSLSKLYNVSVDEIKSQNEALLKNGLQTGQILTIKTNN